MKPPGRRATGASRWRLRRSAGCRGWLLAITIVGITFAHGPEDDQIRLLTAQLERHPQDLTARLRRGELLRDHPRPGDTNTVAMAREDFAYVLRASPHLLSAQLGMARLELASGEFTNALRRLDQALTGTNPIATVHLLRAEALVKCGRPAEAVTSYSEALQRQKDPRAESFLARARAQLAASPTNFSAVLAGLDAGLARLGPVPGLQLLALDIALRARDYTNALARVDALAAESDRQESWLSRRGDVLLAAGRIAEARTAWQKALQACRQLPERLRATPALRDLEADLAQKLASNAPGPAAP